MNINPIKAITSTLTAPVKALATEVKEIAPKIGAAVTGPLDANLTALSGSKSSLNLGGLTNKLDDVAKKVTGGLDDVIDQVGDLLGDAGEQAGGLLDQLADAVTGGGDPVISANGTNLNTTVSVGSTSPGRGRGPSIPTTMT